VNQYGINANINDNLYDEKPSNYSALSDALDKLISLRNKNKLNRLKRLDIPNWINKSNPEAQDFWSGVQLSVANNSSSLSLLGLAGPAGIFILYLLIGIIPVCIPTIYGFIHDKFGFTNMYQPDWVTVMPAIGLFIMITGTPIAIVKYFSRTRDHQKADYLNKYLEWGSNKGYVDQDKLIVTLQTSPPCKQTTFEFLTNLPSQKFKIDNFLRKAQLITK